MLKSCAVLLVLQKQKLLVTLAFAEIETVKEMSLKCGQITLKIIYKINMSE